MSQPSMDSIQKILATTRDPISQQMFADVATITQLSGDAQGLSLSLQFGYPISTVKEALKDALRQALASVASSVSLELDFQIAAAQPFDGAGKVKNVIAVASGKGGVGKSTTAVNLALALAKEGAVVGILDADIYGPSQSLMLGVPKGTRPEVHQQNFFVPIDALGIQAMSMGFLATEETPMVWRGPMASGALQQLLKQTLWNHVDYLIVDMPPGTGDIQLTLSQQVPLAGAVIVTTPQDIALLDAVKGVEMFRKVNVPVFGIVENMAIHVCSKCGHEEHIFGEGGGQKMSEQYGVSVLGSLPLDLSIREQADSGCPTVATDPEGSIAMTYRQIARQVVGQLARVAASSTGSFPKITIEGD